MTDEKKRRDKKVFGLNMLAAAFVFWFMPDLILVDILPDIIGYVLASVALTMLGDLNEDIALAKKKFIRLTLLGAGKLLSVLLIFGFFPANEQPTAILTLTFAVGVGECLMLIPAFNDFFGGMLYLGTRLDGTSVFFGDGKKKYRGSYTDKLKRSTVFFIIAKNTLAVLPELLSLSVNTDNMTYNYGGTYQFIGFYRAFAMMISITIGIIWLCKAMKYIKTIKSDRHFIDALTEKYEKEILPNESIFLRRRFSRAFLLLSVGAMAAIDIYINGVNGFSIIPDVLAGGFIFAGICCLTEKAPKNRLPAMLITSAYTLLSAVTYVVNYLFSYKYTAKEILLREVPNKIWIVLIAVSVVEAVLFSLMIAFTCRLLSETVKNNTGILTSKISIDPIARMNELHRRLNIRLKIGTVFACIAGCGGVYRIVMLANSRIMGDSAWLVESALTLIFAIVLCMSLYRIKSEIEEKYLML